MFYKYAVKHTFIVIQQFCLEKSSQKYLEDIKISHNFALAFENETISKANTRTLT